MTEPQLHDTVFVAGQALRIVAFSEDDGTKLSDGRWVCASKFVPVTRAGWRYEPNRTVSDYAPPSARQILWDAGVPEDIIDGALHVHAHELAGRLRAEMGPKDMVPGESERIQRYVTGWYGAADLIDPEVTP
jgi:hypothetical protein